MSKSKNVAAAKVAPPAEPVADPELAVDFVEDEVQVREEPSGPELAVVTPDEEEPCEPMECELVCPPVHEPRPEYHGRT